MIALSPARFCGKSGADRRRSYPFVLLPLIALTIPLTGCGGGNGLSSSIASEEATRARGASVGSPSPAPSTSPSPKPSPSGSPAPRPSGSPSPGASPSPAPRPSGSPAPRPSSTPSASPSATPPAGQPAPQNGPGGLVVDLAAGSFHLLPPPNAPADAKTLTVQYTASTPIVYPDGSPASLSNGVAVQVQCAPPTSGSTAVNAAKIVVVPTPGTTANVSVSSSAAGGFDLLPPPPPPAAGSGSSSGSSTRAASSSPAPKPTPAPLHVLTGATTVYKKRAADGTATAARATDLKSGILVGVFGTVAPKAGTLTATEVDLLPAPPKS